jgi:Spy/CpxP family protein refolding chaperone
MNRWIKLLLLFGVVVVTAGTANFVTSRLFYGRTPGLESEHIEIHQKLGLTPEQEKRLEPLEQRFAQQKEQLLHIIRQANGRLAKAIREDKSNSSEIAAAVAAIRAAQGELQKVTLDHVFQMKAVLQPEQYQKLLDLTAQALSDYGD